MSNFRPVDFWKSSIMTLPDNSFFELLRTVFGKIKTPFNKQALLGDLEKFLLRKDIQKNIAGYIDNNDILIITAITALNEPTTDELEIFFSGDFSYAELYDLLINLEERFILYRFAAKEQNHAPSRLALNPVLESVLSPFIADRSLLFPSVSVNEALQNKMLPEKPQFFLDDRILAALLSFVSQNKLFFKGAGGGIRQKILNAAKSLFGDLPLETVIGGLQVLGLFSAEEELLKPDHQRFSAFGGFSRQERLIYCAAGIQCYLDSLENVTPAALSPWLFRIKIYNYAKIMNKMYNSLDTDRQYPQATLQKLAYILNRDNTDNSNNKIIEIMKETGLIIAASQDYWRKELFAENAPPSEKNMVVAMDTPFTLLVYPEITYSDAITLAAFSTVIEAGMTVRFELSRDSVVLAFNRGLSADTIVELLKKLSHNRIDENLLFTLRDWEKCYGEVSIRRGLVLTLSPERRHLAETKLLAGFIVETLAPGIYILSESAEEKAIDALRKAGITIIARRDEGMDKHAISGREEYYGGTSRFFFQSLSDINSPNINLSDFGPPDFSPNTANNASQSNSSASALIDNFHSILNQMRHGKEERDELEARINRRLVLSESQLKDAVIRYEKLEARGLDYVGKAMIAKQAITMQTPVEVVWLGKKKQQERIFGIPLALEKSGSESVLIIKPMEFNNDDPMRFSLGKISSLRRIKKSIFEG